MTEHELLPPDMLEAYGELQNLLLAIEDVNSFLHEVAVLAAEVFTPSAACGITLRRDGEVRTAARSNELAVRIDELQYGRGVGPCLQALHTGQPVIATDLSADDRWGDYRLHAIAHGVGACMCLPLTAHHTTIGALNLFITHPHNFTDSEVSRATAFAGQASGAVSIALRVANQTTLEGQLRDALASRAVIDQALGLVMGQLRCTAEHAFATLREASINRNVKMRAIAAEVIQNMTGHPAQPSRPFVQR